MLDFNHFVFDSFEVVLSDIATSHLTGRYSGLLCNNAGRQLLGGHFQREETDNAAVNSRHVAIGSNFACPGPSDIVGNVSCEGGLAHSGPTGEDDQIGGL